MRILAIDHGLARCGCAISDPSGTLVRPLETLPPEVPAFVALVEAERVESIVVGLPLSMDGSEGTQAAIVREFCDQLEQALEIPVDTWDERLTTAMANNSRRGGATAAEDSLAAAHLLESYLLALESRSRSGLSEPEQDLR